LPIDLIDCGLGIGIGGATSYVWAFWLWLADTAFWKIRVVEPLAEALTLSLPWSDYGGI